MLRLFPRPTAPRARGGWCQCRCHDMVEGDVLAAAQHTGAALRPSSINGLGAVAVACHRADEAAVACDVCRPHHAVALSGRPPELGYTPRPKVAEAPRPAWADGKAAGFSLPPQADGGADDGN